MQNDQKPKGIKQRGNIWWVDKTVRVGEQRIQLRESTGCRALTDAIAYLERREEEIRRLGTTRQLDRWEINERTFEEASAEYIVDLENRGKDASRALQDIRLVIGVIGHLPLSHIHQRALQSWINSQQGIRSSGTVGRALRTVATVLHFAAEVLRDGNIPWLAMAPPKLRSPDWGSRQPCPISWEEQDRLIEVMPKHLIGPVLFATETGARQAEITTLRWCQHRRYPGIPDHSIWWIPPEVRKASSKKAASQQDGRYLVCNRAARIVIERQRGQSSEWVFLSPKRDSGLYRVNNHGWRAAVKAVGLEIRFHDLRHTFGERAADAGIPLDIRRSLLGHEHRDITLHYSSPGLARLLEEAERVVRPEANIKY
ncbi:tyrosine-type recombinase/integrase [Thiocystis violacea]|uniref:tyrosine-type recombinase/integrase n=1 Tax=Thiocystis violacea TaxID=13725 RepID=UPI00190310CA|nr:site-specific integrase [Thiocystis violacea]MBK1717286.1 hypothetical protein [Thiocystis violacea]